MLRHSSSSNALPSRYILLDVRGMLRPRREGRVFFCPPSMPKSTVEVLTCIYNHFPPRTQAYARLMIDLKGLKASGARQLEAAKEACEDDAVRGGERVDLAKRYEDLQRKFGETKRVPTNYSVGSAITPRFLLFFVGRYVSTVPVLPFPTTSTFFLAGLGAARG